MFCFLFGLNVRGFVARFLCLHLRVDVQTDKWSVSPILVKTSVQSSWTSLTNQVCIRIFWLVWAYEGRLRGFFTTAMERNNSSSISAPWVQIQQKTFTNWVNEQLRPAGKQVDDLVTDFEDGLMLITLLDSLVASRGLPMYKKRISYCKNPKLRVQKMENVSHALQMMERAGIKMVNVGKFKWITIMNACWWVMLGVRENQNGGSRWVGTSCGHLSIS